MLAAKQAAARGTAARPAGRLRGAAAAFSLLAAQTHYAGRGFVVVCACQDK